MRRPLYSTTRAKSRRSWRPHVCLLLTVLVTGCAAGTGEATAIAWQRVAAGTASRASVQALVFDPANPGAMLAAVAGPIGVYASQDGGQTWQPSGDGLGGRQVFALLADPKSPREWLGHFQRLKAEPGLARSLRDKGRRQAVRFSWKESAKAYLGLVTALLRGKRLRG